MIIREKATLRRLIVTMRVEAISGSICQERKAFKELGR